MYSVEPWVIWKKKGYRYNEQISMAHTMEQWQRIAKALNHKAWNVKVHSKENMNVVFKY